MANIPDSLIDTQSALNEVCETIAPHKTFCLDTEFMRVRTYSPQLALIQIAAGEHIFCIDPVADLDLSRFWELVFAADRIIMHSAKQDFEALYYYLGKVPDNLFDTQIAASLCGHPAQIGYAGLCQALLGIELPKSQTRSDWLQRPLTSAQIVYAAEDVAHLQEMSDLLEEELTKLDRLDWAAEDSGILCDIQLYAPDADSAWQRIKSIPFMQPADQARAVALARWREDRAVKLDKPRNWILTDAAIKELAANNPGDAQSMKRCEEIPPATLRKQGERLIDLLSKANQRYSDGDYQAVQQQQPDEAYKKLIKQLAGIVKSCADQLNIPAEVVASKRELNAIIQGDMTQRSLNGWRKTKIGEQLLAEINKQKC